MAAQPVRYSREWLAGSYYFPPGAQLRSGRNYDNNSLCLITPYKKADRMTDILVETYLSIYPEGLPVVIDMTACVGGNTISFARDRRVAHVHAYETNRIWFSYLLSNISAYELMPRVTLYDYSSLETLNTTLYSDSIVFIDPLWDHLDPEGSLMLGNQNVEDVISELFRSRDALPGLRIEGAAVVGLKVPPGYRLRHHQGILYEIDNPDSIKRRRAKIWMYVLTRPEDTDRND
jgi:hypothetical protein